MSILPIEIMLHLDFSVYFLLFKVKWDFQFSVHRIFCLGATL